MEHLEGVIEKPESDMTPQELQLHYFKMHDYDGNNLLDGLELATAITHVHREVSLTLHQYKARTHLSLSVICHVLFFFITPNIATWSWFFRKEEMTASQ